MKKIKRCFIPNKENNYLPHFFKFKVAAIIAIILAGIFLLTFIILQTRPFTDFLASVYPGVLVSYTNETRKNIQNEKTLSINPLLEKAAQLKAQDMATNGYFSHVSPDGKTPWYWFNLAGYSFKYAGENLAINFQDSKDIYNAWIESPDHKANILNSKFTEIGIATANGIYKGQETIFVVQLFGTPSDQKLPASIQSKPENYMSITIPEAGIKQIAGNFTNRSESINFRQKILSSPRTSIGWFYIAAMAAIIILILLAAVIEFRLTHRSVWINGLTLLFIIFLIVVANNYIYLVESAII